MIWKCEVRNSYTGKEEVWTEIEITGNDFLTEFRKRFGKLNFRNVQQFDFTNLMTLGDFLTERLKFH